MVAFLCFESWLTFENGAHLLAPNMGFYKL